MEYELGAGVVGGGDYRILRPLAAGGMGVVYLAEQISTARRRALKVLLRDLAGDPAVADRFVLEALLMRNRFMAFEVYEEWFEGRLSRDAWREVVGGSRGMMEFRRVMFSRLVPNLREIGLLSPRIKQHYDAVGLLQYMDGLSADRLSGDAMIAELDRAA